MANIRQSPVKKNTVWGLQRWIWIYNQIVTWEYKDEKGTDPSDDTDDFADVWYKDSNEKRHCNPQDCQHVAAPAFKLHCHHSITLSPPPQEGVLNHRSDAHMMGCFINQEPASVYKINILAHADNLG